MECYCLVTLTDF